jgi:hypothetical protein
VRGQGGGSFGLLDPFAPHSFNVRGKKKSMKSRQAKVRGRNTISRRLNKPIDGKLAERKSSLFIFTVLTITFLVLLIYACSILVLKYGFIITPVIGCFGVVVLPPYYQSTSEKYS